MNKLNLNNAVILDTETTGLGQFDEVCEVSIIDALHGNELFSSLICPSKPIPLDVTRIHGITYDVVRDAPSIVDVWPQIESVLSGRELLTYNSDFDVRLLLQSIRYSGCDASLIASQEQFLSSLPTSCVMHWYAEFFGEINVVSGDFRWQSLSSACSQQGIDVSDLVAHRALADCEMTKRLIHSVNSQISEA